MIEVIMKLELDRICLLPPVRQHICMMAAGSAMMIYILGCIKPDICEIICTYSLKIGVRGFYSCNSSKAYYTVCVTTKLHRISNAP
jgi:hypothetical protein